MTKRLAALALAAASVLVSPVKADVYNLKVVTDANPDYTDLPSLIHSATSRWEKDSDKVWAMFYWNHIARRQTNPMMLHGKPETDPIRQFNDHGFTMCSTISGINCSIFSAMGLGVRYYDVAAHTVMEVEYDGQWHMIDSSLSAIYTTCDGKTIAALGDLGKTMGCEASGGKEEAGHIVKYHCLNASSPNGFLEGADTFRDLAHLGEDTFNPKYLKHRTYYNDAERGHRYILNLRDGEVYTRSYTRLDNKKGAKGEFLSDPNYYISNGKTKDGREIDPESKNPRYRIRGNGQRTYQPAMTLAALHSYANLKEASGVLTPADPSQPGEAVFKIEGANVITSTDLTPDVAGSAKLAISTTNGLTWTEVQPGRLRDEVNGAYEVLAKVTLTDGAQLKGFKADTITQINSKTQPQLKLGKNTVYVGAGPQEESIVFWPELQADRYKPYTIESVNIKTKPKHEAWNGVLGVADPKAGEGYMVYKIDAPHDITQITQGARMYVRANKAAVRFEHSFDGGRTWTESFKFTDTEQPWDDIHHQVIKDIPPGTRSVLLKYALNNASLYSVRMEVNHKVPNPTPGPIEVTFNWAERNEDYSLTERSFTKLVDRLPTTFDINVGGHDHPIVRSLIVNPKGARGELKYGYSDGKDVGGEKFVGQWVTYGRNLAAGKPYTASVESDTQWDAGDPEGKVLTDGVVGASYAGGVSFRYGTLYSKGSKPEIVIDLGESQKFQAVRAHIMGYPAPDAIQGGVKDRIEVLTSTDGTNFTSQGEFDFRLYWKDIPVNFMWNDQETFQAHNHTLKFKQPIEARYVKFNVTPVRQKLGISELQVIETVESKPFDLRIALPNDVTTAQAAK